MLALHGHCSTQALMLQGNCKELFSTRLTDVQVRDSGMDELADAAKAAR
jgi:hypothetical protein